MEERHQTLTLGLHMHKYTRTCMPTHEGALLYSTHTRKIKLKYT